MSIPEEEENGRGCCSPQAADKEVTRNGLHRFHQDRLDDYDNGIKDW